VPNQATINVPLCQTSNITVSFSNVQWGTNFESPTLCFGSITTYEYQLPSGWVLNGVTSTGSNWIAGSSGVSITPDATTGDGGVILIRPTNSCASGLQNGQVPGQIPISRPQPNLTTTASNICGGTYAFTLQNVPSGSSVVWSSSSNIAFSGTPTNSGASVTRNSTGNGSGYVQADITLPCSSTVITKRIDIPVGLATPFFSVAMTGCDLEGQGISNNFQQAVTYNWYVNGNFYSHLRKIFTTVNDGDIYELTVSNSDCGVSDGYWEHEYCDYSFSLSPNPATSVVTVETTDGSAISEVRISDKGGNLKKQTKYSGKNKKEQVSLASLPAGVYTIQAFNGKKWVSKQLVKQ